MSCEVIILAAGKGKRMLSAKSKILHKIAGKSMINHQLDTLASMKECDAIHLVIGHDRDQLLAEVNKHKDHNKISIIEQFEQLGTGHATAQALPSCHPESIVLVLAADIPLISTKVLAELYLQACQKGIALLEAEVEQPFGYGRILCSDDDKIVGIVEEKDASSEQRRITRIYSGVLAAKHNLLTNWLARINSNNAQSELYLTDIVALAAGDGINPASVMAGSIFDYTGINTRIQLANLRKLWQNHLSWQLVEKGLGLVDPDRFDLRGNLSFGTDVEIDINTVIIGEVTLGNNVTIGAHSYLENCTIAEGTIVHPFSHVCSAVIGRNCIIGPYARLRPDSELADNVRVGNFVEVKKSRLGNAVKVNHLSYIGDATIGALSNIGAGTITCNYDGIHKHTTKIGENAFIGSNTALVAPVELGNRTTIAAGSVITHKVEDNSLAISRTKQRNIANCANLTKRQDKSK